MLKISLVVISLLAVAVASFFVLNWAPDRPVDALKGRWAPQPSKFISIDGMQVHYRDQGPRNDPSPIVLIHGTGSSLHTWEAWVSSLEVSHRVISFDRPGFGLTGPNPDGDYHMAYYVAFTRHLLDALGVDHFIVVGSSSGGRVAWHLALDLPQRVDRLVLISAAGYPRHTPLPIGLRIAMSPTLSGLMSHVLPRSSVQKSLQGVYGDPSKVTQEIVDRNYEITLRAGNRAALGATLRQAESEDESSSIREIHMPTLIIWGDRDTVIPPSDAEKFHRDIAGSQLTMISASGHMSQEEDPSRTLAAFQDFLGR